VNVEIHCIRAILVTFTLIQAKAEPPLTIFGGYRGRRREAFNCTSSVHTEHLYTSRP
jgi:hypothetical protein